MKYSIQRIAGIMMKEMSQLCKQFSFLNELETGDITGFCQNPVPSTRSRMILPVTKVTLSCCFLFDLPVAQGILQRGHYRLLA